MIPSNTSRPAPRNRFHRWGLGLALTLALATPALSTPTAQAADPATVSPAVLVQEMTGTDSTTNTKTTWDIGATDLGIIWDDGAGHVLTAFGDTFSDPGADGAGVGNWRSNVLLRSSDRDLSDGMAFDWALTGPDGKATEMFGSKKVDNDEMTTIPTAAISVGSRQYVEYMSVKHWGAPGEWDTNFSQLAYSDDGGKTWSIEGAPRWNNNAEGTDPMQMKAFTRHGGFVYVFGTPNGRMGAASLARVSEDKMLDKSAYQYWTGTDWSSDYSQLKPIIEPKVAELSVRYDESSGKWQMIYLDGNADLVLRVADDPTGPWGPKQLIASQAEYPGLYGGYIHPWSPDGEIYFAMSIWNQYNSALMKVSIDDQGTIVRPNLLRDSSFERSDKLDVPGGWTASGNAGIDTNSFWAKLDRRQFYVRSASGTHHVTQQVTLTPHTDYRLTGWFKTGDTAGGNAGQGQFGVRAVGPGGATLGQTTFTDLAGWTQFTVEFNSGSATQVEVFAGSTMTADRWVQGDDISLVAIGEPQAAPSTSPSASSTSTPSQPPSEDDSSTPPAATTATPTAPGSTVTVTVTATLTVTATRTVTKRPQGLPNTGD